MIANVDEPAVEVIDGEMTSWRRSHPPSGRRGHGQTRGGGGGRRAAAKEARRAVREQRKAEIHANVDERVGKLKEKLHVS